MRGSMGLVVVVAWCAKMVRCRLSYARPSHWVPLHLHVDAEVDGAPVGMLVGGRAQALVSVVGAAPLSNTRSDLRPSLAAHASAPARAARDHRVGLGTASARRRGVGASLTLYTNSATDEVVQAASAGARATATVATTSNHAAIVFREVWQCPASVHVNTFGTLLIKTILKERG
jgi:hypothetical protein